MNTRTAIARTRTLTTAIVAAVALLPVAPVAASGLQGYITTDRGTSRVEPPGAGQRTWTPIPANGEVEIELEKGVNRVWIAFPNVVNPNPKLFTLEWSGPPGGPRAEVWTWDGLVGPGRKVGRGGTRWIHHAPSENRYSKSFRFTTCPAWERFELHIIADEDQTATYSFCGDSTCMFLPRFPPWHPFHRLMGQFGVAGAMHADVRVTELWLFPRTAFVDGKAPQPMEAPPHTGAWTSEIVTADPEGDERGGGGVRWSTDGAGLSVEDVFDATVTTVGYADQRYDLYLLDAARDAYVRMVSGPGAWADAFDTYAVGPLAGLGGWEPWDDDDGAAGFVVTDAIAHSAPHALATDGSDDAVQRFAGHVDGQWEMSARVYVPAAMDDTQHVILLNTYPAGPFRDWSLQIALDGASGEVRDRNSEASLPLARDRWVPLRVLIDLDRDVQTVWYDGQPLLTKGWSDGVAEGGARAIAAIDLFASGSAHQVFYDDLTLREVTIVGACELADGTCEDVSAEACAAADGVYHGDGSACPSCPADLDDDGHVAFGDLLLLLAAWGPCEDACAADLDGDGLVGFGDLLDLLTAWGACG